MVWIQCKAGVKDPRDRVRMRRKERVDGQRERCRRIRNIEHLHDATSASFFPVTYPRASTREHAVVGVAGPNMPTYLPRNVDTRGVADHGRGEAWLWSVIVEGERTVSKGSGGKTNNVCEGVGTTEGASLPGKGTLLVELILLLLLLRAEEDCEVEMRISE